MFDVKSLAKELNALVREDKDAVIGITGNEGIGKSALSIGLGLEIDPLFSVERNILYLPDVNEVKKKIYNLPPYSPVIGDEAIKIMYKLNWATKASKLLNQIYAVCRKENKISIFNMPRFNDFQEFFRNHRLKVWIHIYDGISNRKDEGHAAVMVRTWNPIATDAWGTDVFDKIIKKRQKAGMKEAFYTLTEKARMFESLPSFVGHLRFNWVDDVHWHKYLQLKNEAHNDEMEESLESARDLLKEKWKNRTVMAIKAMLSMGKKHIEIAKVLGIHREQVYSLLKDEVNAKKIKEFA